MEQTQDPQDRIDRYVLGRMEPAERTRFEALLGRDAGLQREVTAQQELAGLLEKAGDARLRRQLDGVYAQVTGEERARTRWGRTAWAAAASVVLVVALLLALWGRREGNSNNLFAQYYRPEPYLVTRNAEESTGNGGVYFNEGNYRQALEAFGARLRQNPGADYDLLYAGLCYLQVGEYDRAAESFTRVAARSQLLRERATWYLALTYLKSNRVEASKTALRELAAGTAGSRHARAARQLLNDLE